MSTVRLHNMIMKTTALGPGDRIAVWFQGCKKRCKGCMSPLSRSLDGGVVCSTEKIIDIICSAKGIEGVTISGGEPFVQIEQLHMILSEIKRRTSLGVIIYTGYTLEEIKTWNNNLANEILESLSDIVIDGEYIEELNNGTCLRGSDNQRVNFITDRYLAYKELYDSRQRDVQVFINNNKALLVGIPDKNTLKSWIETTG